MRLLPLVLGLFWGLFLPFLSFAESQTVPNPSCSQTKFAEAFFKQDKANLAFIIDRCAYLGLNQLLNTRTENRGPQQKMTLLHLAIRKDWADFVETLLKRQDIEPNRVDEAKYTPLGLAWELQKLSYFDRLLQDPRVDLNAQHVSTNTILETTLVGKDAETRLKSLLKYPQLDINARGPIWLAANHPERRPLFLMLLNEPRINLNIQRHKQNLLTWATSAMRMELIDDLLSSGKVSVNEIDGNNHTALSVAVGQKDLSLVRLFIEKYRAQVTSWSVSVAYGEKAQDILHYLVNQTSYDINQSNSLFLSAIIHWRLEVIRLFLARDDFDFAKSQVGLDSLKRVMNKSDVASEDAIDIFNSLIAKPGVDLNFTDKQGNNFAHWIAERQSASSAMNATLIAVLKSLPQIDLNAKNKLGLTPLCATILNRSWSGQFVVEFLRQPTVDVNLECGGRSPWMHALSRSSQHGVNAIQKNPRFDVKKIGDINQDLNGTKPIVMAAELGTREAFDLLMSQPELDVNVTVRLSSRIEIPLIENIFRRIGPHPGTDFHYFNRLILDPRLDRSVLPKMKNEEGCTLLLFAMTFDREDLLEESLRDPQTDILARGGCPKSGFWDQRNILDLAVNKGRMDLVQRLFPKHPALLKSPESGGWAFAAALRAGRIDMIEYFMTNGYLDLVDKVGSGDEERSVLNLAIARKNKKVLEMSLKVEKVNLNDSFYLRRTENSFFSFQGAAGLAAHMGWTEGLRLILTDKRTSADSVSHALLELIQYQSPLSTSPEFAQAFDLLFNHPKLNINVNVVEDGRNTILGEAIEKRIPRNFIDKLLAHKKIEVTPAFFKAYWVKDIELGTRLVRHPSFNPMLNESTAKQGYWLVNGGSRDWYNLWASHPKARPGALGDEFIKQLMSREWTAELLKALDTYSGDWKKSAPWSHWHQVNQRDPKAAREFLLAFMAKKNRPAEKDLSGLLGFLLENKNSEDLALEFLGKFKGWNLNDLRVDSWGEKSILVYAAKNQQMRVLEWALRNPAVQVIFENDTFLNTAICRSKSLEQFQLALSIRRKDFVEAHLKDALRGIRCLQTPADATQVINTLLPQIRDWSRIAEELLPFALKNGWEELMHQLIERDRETRYESVTVNGLYLISWTVTVNRLDLMELFLNLLKLSINGNWSGDTTPLIEAVKLNRIDFVRFILKVPNVRTDYVDKNKMTALDWAATLGHQEIVELLKDRRR